MSQTIEVKVPDIGDFKDVEVIEILVKPGDAVAVEQSLVTVESDKASMEIPSSAAGVIKTLRVRLGDKVSEGSVLLDLETDASAGTAPAQATAAAAPSPPAPSSSGSSAGAGGPPAAPAASSGEPRLVKVPDIGDFKDVEVIEILVKPGDTVAAEQSLITVESDKASMEIPSPVAGVVEAMKVSLGDKVSEGSPVLVLRAAEAGAAPAGPEAAAAAEAPAVAPPPTAAARTSAPVAGAPRPERAPPVPPEPGDTLSIVKPHASPSVRRFARELGVDLAQVRGSGPKQRILHDDVRAFVKDAVARAGAGGAGAAPVAAAGGAGGAALGLIPWPSVDFAKFGPVETKPLSRIKKISSANLHRNWVMIPHVTNHEDADITELEAFRVQLNQENAKSGVKVTMLAFLIKACVAALKRFPEFNASLDGENLVFKQYWHIGFAADTPNGLVVPVIKDADSKGILQIAKEMADLSAKAREGKLGPSDMQGGTFSISSLGGIGGTYFTPIINAPEVAILGVCRSATKPVWDGKQFAPRLMLPLSLSWDHRVIDGAAAARFNAYLAQLLADFRRTML